MAPIKNLLSIIALVPLALAAPQDVGSINPFTFTSLTHILPGETISVKFGPLTEPQGPATASGELPSPSDISLAPGPVIVSRTDLVSAPTDASTVPSGVVGSMLSGLASSSAALESSLASASAALSSDASDASQAVSSEISQITGPVVGASTSAGALLSSVSDEFSSVINSITSGVSTGAAPKETGVLAGAAVAMGGIVGIAMVL